MSFPRVISILSLFALILLAHEAHAVTAEASDADSKAFQSWALAIPQQLAKQGIHRVGALDLDELQDNIKQIHAVIAWAGSPVMNGSGLARRHTAINVPTEKTVVVMESEFQGASNPARAMIGLHESLDVAGFDDENYGLSTSLYQMSQNPSMVKSPLAIPFQNLMPRAGNRVYEQSGGATGVGGGGDDVGIYIKELMLSFGMTLAPEKQAEYFSRVLKLKLEPTMETPDETPISMDPPDEKYFFRIVSPTSIAYNRDLFLAEPVEIRGKILGEMIRALGIL